MNSEKYFISVIVISFNGMEFIDDCLTTVLTSLESVDSEIIVIDNRSQDGTVELIEDKFPMVRLIKNGSNLGFARAANQGFNMSRGEYILLLNQDTRIQNQAIVKLAERIKSDSHIGTIGPKFVDFSGRLQKTCRSFPRYRDLIYAITGLSRLFSHSRVFSHWKMGWFDHESEREVDQPMGAALMIRQNVLQRLGGFDESFKIFFNDVDFCRRVREAGYVNLYYPWAVIEHFYGGTIRKMKGRMVREWHRSIFRYFRKYSRSLMSRLLLAFWGPVIFFSGFIRAAYYRITGA